jgi:Fe-S-cluster-containing dehydrogenase component
VSLEHDFLTWSPGKLRYARDFARRRKAMSPAVASMARLYVVESAPTITGAMADHRFVMKSSQIPSIAQAMSDGTSTPPWIAAVLDDLEKHRGRGVVMAGDAQPPAVHALVHQLNDRFGNIGTTVYYTEPTAENPVQHSDSLLELVNDMAADRVETLIMLGGNPAYTAPADVHFAEQLAKVPLRVRQSMHYDETAARSHWHIPESHYLESWGDLRAYDGTVSIVQPLINPLYQTRSPYELLAALIGDSTSSNYDIIRNRWSKRRPNSFDPFWEQSLRDGIVPETRSLEVTAKPNAAPPVAATASAGLEIVFRPDPTLYDGRWATNAWLQELPKPLTKLVWDNAALMSDATARGLGVESQDVIQVELGGRSIEAAVLIVAGHADDSITLPLGHGRQMAGNGSKTGFNAYMLRSSASPWFTFGATVRKTGRRYPLATTQRHHELNGRNVALHATIAEYEANPHFAAEKIHTPAKDETLYPAFASEDYAWGMSVDMSACIGCNACVIACQAENNIPVVGKAEVDRSREMHWLRIDTYYEGESKNPRVLFQPMLCQHCENAPCELPCPVEATSHSAEGLNEMTYNRCVGTRYCSNNCPYKVRRFNFFEYTEWDIPQFKLLYNPDVTVRSRGVMEKCTYCVQRINRARITAKKEDRLIRDGEVVTACQAACPAEVIRFGNILDPEAAVCKDKAQPRSYGVLSELNTRPRTTYLAKLTNPNPGL